MKKEKLLENIGAFLGIVVVALIVLFLLGAFDSSINHVTEFAFKLLFK